MSSLTVKDGKPAIEYQGTIRVLNAIQKNKLAQVMDDRLAIEQLLQDESFINGYRKKADNSLRELEPTFNYEKNGWLAIPTDDGTFVINDSMTPDKIGEMMKRLSNNYAVARDFYTPATKRGIADKAAEQKAALISKTIGDKEVMKQTGLKPGHVQNLIAEMAKKGPKVEDIPIVTANEKEHEAPKIEAPKIEPVSAAADTTDLDTPYETDGDIIAHDTDGDIIPMSAKREAINSAIKTLREFGGKLSKILYDNGNTIVSARIANGIKHDDLSSIVNILKEQIECTTGKKVFKGVYLGMLSYVDEVSSAAYDGEIYRGKHHDELFELNKSGKGILDEAYDRVEYETGGKGVSDIIDSAVYQAGQVQKKVPTY